MHAKIFHVVTPIFSVAEMQHFLTDANSFAFVIKMLKFNCFFNFDVVLLFGFDSMSLDFVIDVIVIVAIIFLFFVERDLTFVFCFVLEGLALFV